MRVLAAAKASGAAGLILSTGCAYPLDSTDVARCAPSRTLAYEAELEPDESGGEHIVVGETDVTLSRHPVGIQGSGEDLVRAVDITWGRGAIELGCRRVPLVLTSYQDVSNGGRIQALGVDRQGWFPLTFVCGAEGSLDWVGYQSTGGLPPTWERAQGRCQVDVERGKRVRLRLPGTDMPRPALLEGYSIDGPLIHLSGGTPGVIVVEGVDYPLFAFNAIDCGQDCDEPRWHEIHAIIGDPGEARASYAVLLLERPGDPVRVISSISMPGFGPGTARGEELFATFTTP